MNNNKHIPLTADEKQGCQNIIQGLIDLCKGIRLCVIASADGFVMAEVNERGESGERLAAMSSSMVGLASAISEELSFGELDTLVMDSAMGKVIMLSAPTAKQDLALLASCTNDVTIGQVLYNAKSSVKQIKELVQPA